MTASSGTTTFAPAFSDLLLDSFSRIQVRPASITSDHLYQARMSANLLLSEWSVRGVELWKVEEFTIPLVQGVPTYSLPGSTVGLLDVFVRQYQMNTATSVAPAFSTTVNSATVTVTQANHGLTPGAWAEYVVPVSIGGIILLGPYQAVTVPDANTYTITAATWATGTASGGAVPSFTSTSGSSTITVTLPSHGISLGQDFAVQVPTVVGGVTLSGIYTVSGVTSIDVFTITAQDIAGSAQTVSENGGLASIETQSVLANPTDRPITPISRTDYASQPDKLNQSYPSTFWFNRQINPSVTLWPVPDNNGPYVLHYYALVQTDDVVVPGGVGVDVPWRYLRAFALGLAADLATKYPCEGVQGLMAMAEQAWAFASVQDTENTPIFISPMMDGYFR